MKNTLDKFHELYWLWLCKRNFPFAVFSYFITIVTMLILCLTDNLTVVGVCMVGNFHEAISFFTMIQPIHPEAIFFWLSGSKATFFKKKKGGKPSIFAGNSLVSTNRWWKISAEDDINKRKSLVLSEKARLLKLPQNKQFPYFLTFLLFSHIIKSIPIGSMWAKHKKNQIIFM